MGVAAGGIDGQVFDLKAEIDGIIKFSADKAPDLAEAATGTAVSTASTTGRAASKAGAVAAGLKIKLIGVVVTQVDTVVNVVGTAIAYKKAIGATTELRPYRRP